MEIIELLSNLSTASIVMFVMCIAFFFRKMISQKSIYTIPFVVLFIGALLLLLFSQIVGFYYALGSSIGTILQVHWSILLAFIIMTIWILVMLFVERGYTQIKEKTRKYSYIVLMVVVVLCWIYFMWQMKQINNSITDLNTAILFWKANKASLALLPVNMFLLLESNSILDK